MPIRALIIAIENYADVKGGGIAKSLPGTLKAGLDFKNWLTDKWQAEGRQENDTQLLFCSEPKQPGGTSATRKDILTALRTLKQDGQSATSELYFFFSGHGFSFSQKPGSRADIVITSDFEEAALSGDCCLNLDEIVSWLRDHLGPGRHYYFVDACRNALDAKQIQIGSLLPVDPQASPEASTFLLQSTVPGAVAAVGGPFPDALMAGLRGKGNAKVWDKSVKDAMLVRYDSLRRHLKQSLIKQQQITSKVEGEDGESDGILATIRPVPKSKCTIQIDAASPLQGFVTYQRGPEGKEVQQPLADQPVELTLEPDDYLFSICLNDGGTDPPTPIAVDLYDDQTLVFRKVLAKPAKPGLESISAGMKFLAQTEVAIDVPSGASIELRHLNTGKETRVDTSKNVILPHGRYFATLRAHNNQTLRRKEIEIGPGIGNSLNLAQWQQSVPHLAIASKLPADANGVDFSESLGGPVVDPDLDLWLALLGGGHILGPRGDYSKLSKFPLRDFAQEQPGASPLYLLAGFEDPLVQLTVGLSDGTDNAWTDAQQPLEMFGIREAYLPTNPGSHLVSFRVAGGETYTVASFTSPNRAMLITLTLDEEGTPRVSQYLLPLGHLLDHLHPDVRQRLLQRNQLNDVRFVAQASRAFRKRRVLTKQLGPSELSDLLAAKWLDPIASSLAAYESFRRGNQQAMHDVTDNMERYFPHLPDTQALAKLSGRPVTRPEGIPLFLDGLRAFPDYAKWLPLPAGHLDFSSPWTAWRAAEKS